MSDQPTSHLPQTDPPAPAPLPVGPPRYEFLAEVARGGMGIVYRARDTGLNRHVAVKVLKPTVTSQQAARRFLDEAQITGQLQHPGIPPVHEVGTLPDGRPFLAMKLIKGRTLADLLASGDLASRGASAPGSGSLVAAFEQVCHAVAYAHNHGVIHRDLKPQNVMVGAFGEVQVMDWGLAKFRTEARADSPEATAASTLHDPRADADEDLRTRTGSFLGTPAYMAPEQAIGAIDQLDERTDVFGLGAILCAVLTGQPPYVSETAESTRQLAARGALDDAYARLDDCGADPDLVTLCKRCLSANKDHRAANAGEVAKAVAALRAAADDRARQAELDRVRAEDELRMAELKAREQRKRWLVRVVALLVLLGATMLATGFAYWAGIEYDRAERNEEAAKRVNEVEAERRSLWQEQQILESRYAVQRQQYIQDYFQAARECFFFDGPSPGPSAVFTRSAIEQIQSTQFAGGGGNSPDDLWQVANAHRFAAELHALLGEYDKAAELLRRAALHYLHMYNAKKEDPLRLSEVAGVTFELAVALKAAGDPGRAAEEFEKSIPWNDQLIIAATAAAKDLKDARKKTEVWATGIDGHARRALALMELGRHGEAVRDWDAIPWWMMNSYSTVRLNNYGLPGSYHRHQGVCLSRVDLHRAEKEMEQLVSDVEQRERSRVGLLMTRDERGEVISIETLRNWEVGKKEPVGVRRDHATPLRIHAAVRELSLYHDAAAVLSAVSFRHQGLDRERCAARAVALLNELKERGYFLPPPRIEQLARDAIFDPIRSRNDFQQFRASLWPTAPPPREVTR